MAQNNLKKWKKKSVFLHQNYAYTLYEDKFTSQKTLNGQQNCPNIISRRPLVLNKKHNEKKLSIPSLDK